MRAQTANAKTQVELAQYKYMLPRLQRLWTHLERQGGGSGAGGGKGSVGLRGPGETQLEMSLSSSSFPGSLGTSGISISELSSPAPHPAKVITGTSSNKDINNRFIILLF